MAQVSSIGPLPDPNLHIQTGTIKNAVATSQKAASTTVPLGIQSDEAQTSPLQAQLTRLSSVLNGLQQGAATSRSQYVQAYNQVRSGSYQVNSQDVSRSIVNDLLSQQ